MGRVVWMALNPIFFFYAFLPVIIFGIIATLPIPPRVSSMVILTLSSSYIAAMLYLIIHRSLVIVVEFTVDGLVIGRGGRRGGVFIPKSVVVTGNVVCIRWANEICIVGCIRMGPKPILDVTYESFDYTIPLSQRQYDRLVNGLATHWGWIPPECPRT